MKNFHLIVTLFFSVAGTIGCQPLKNRASFIKLECGLGSEAYESDTRVVQFLNANGAPLARDLAVTIDSLPSSVSEHGCIVLPSKGPLELRAISPSTQTGIRLQTSIDAMYSKIQLARLPDAIVGEFTCPKTLAVRNKEELFVPFSLLDSGGHGLVSYNQITEIQYNLKTNGSESLPIAAIDPLKDPNPLRLIASRLTTMNIPDGQYQAELRIKSLRGIEFRTLSPCFINFKSTAPANDLKIFSGLVVEDRSPVITKPLGGEIRYICFQAAADSISCQDRKEFQPVGDRFLLPSAGQWNVFSFIRDSFGNDSEMKMETVFADAKPPMVSIKWVASDLNRVPSLMRSKRHGLTIDTSDDSELADPSVRERLLANLECRAQFSLNQPGLLTGNHVRCLYGRCQGKTLEDWTACDSNVMIRLDYPERHEGQNLRIEVRTVDDFGRVNSASANSLVFNNLRQLNPTDGSCWVDLNMAPKDSKDTELFFLNDEQVLAPAFANGLVWQALRDVISGKIWVRRFNETSWSTPVQLEGLSAGDKPMQLAETSPDELVLQLENNGNTRWVRLKLQRNFSPQVENIAAPDVPVQRGKLFEKQSPDTKIDGIFDASLGSMTSFGSDWPEFLRMMLFPQRMPTNPDPTSFPSPNYLPRLALDLRGWYWLSITPENGTPSLMAFTGSTWVEKSIGNELSSHAKTWIVDRKGGVWAVSSGKTQYFAEYCPNFVD